MEKGKKKKKHKYVPKCTPSFGNQRPIYGLVYFSKEKDVHLYVILMLSFFFFFLPVTS